MLRRLRSTVDCADALVGSPSLEAAPRGLFPHLRRGGKTFGGAPLLVLLFTLYVWVGGAPIS
jgi:hypothetical protein